MTRGLLHCDEFVATGLENRPTELRRMSPQPDDAIESIRSRTPLITQPRRAMNLTPESRRYTPSTLTTLSVKDKQPMTSRGLQPATVTIRGKAVGKPLRLCNTAFTVTCPSTKSVSCKPYSHSVNLNAHSAFDLVYKYFQRCMHRYTTT